jgi:hypothetical protein
MLSIDAPFIRVICPCGRLAEPAIALAVETPAPPARRAVPAAADPRRKSLRVIFIVLILLPNANYKLKKYHQSLMQTSA